MYTIMTVIICITIFSSHFRIFHNLFFPRVILCARFQRNIINLIPKQSIGISFLTLLYLLNHSSSSIIMWHIWFVIHCYMISSKFISAFASAFSVWYKEECGLLSHYIIWFISIPKKENCSYCCNAHKPDSVQSYR